MSKNNWFKENFILSFKIGFNNAWLNLIILPVIFLIEVILIAYFRDSMYDHAAWIIGFPMVAALVLGLIAAWFKRSNPNTQAYYLFHISNSSKVVILLAAVLLIGIYLFAQCGQFGLPVGGQCIQTILGQKG